MAEWSKATDLRPVGEIRVGSNPTPCTNLSSLVVEQLSFQTNSSGPIPLSDALVDAKTAKKRGCLSGYRARLKFVWRNPRRFISCFTHIRESAIVQWLEYLPFTQKVRVQFPVVELASLAQTVERRSNTYR